MKRYVLICFLCVVIAIGLLFRPDGDGPQITGAAILMSNDPNTPAVFVVDIASGTQPDRLIDVEMPSEFLVDLQHHRLNENPWDDGIVVPGGDQISLSRDGAFVALTGGTLSEGALIPVTLKFDHAGAFQAQAIVQSSEPNGNQDHSQHTDVCQIEDGEPEPRVSVAVEPDGDQWTVSVVSENFVFAEPLPDMGHLIGYGHGHVYLNGAKLGRLYEPKTKIGTLPVGTHHITVTLNTNNHRIYMTGDRPVQASTSIVVSAP